jgi:hypothetical protein
MFASKEMASLFQKRPTVLFFLKSTQTDFQRLRLTAYTFFAGKLALMFVEFFKQLTETSFKSKLFKRHLCKRQVNNHFG